MRIDFSTLLRLALCLKLIMLPLRVGESSCLEKVVHRTLLPLVLCLQLMMTAFEDWSLFVEATSWWTVEVHPLLLAMFFSSTARVGTFHWIIFSNYV